MDIEALLLQSEGPGLDFKEEQYRFVFEKPKDPEEKERQTTEKSKLLKDVLAFANSFRQDEAVILIGVRQEGGLREVLGCAEHVDDAALQQFINSKTNIPVQFSYQQHIYQGRELGAIVISHRQRPVYVKKDYGIVKARAVYYREGSSNTEAAPETIHRMGLADAERARPNLRLVFVDLKTRSALSEPVQFAADAMPPFTAASFPDYAAPRSGLLGDMHATRVNAEFWRELASYLRINLIARPLGFAIEDTSGTNAERVRLSFEIAASTGLEVYEELPSVPETQFNPMKGFRSLLQPQPVKVELFGDRWIVEIDFGDIPPRTTAWAPQPVFLGAQRSGTYPIVITLSARNLPHPVVVTHNIEFQVESHEPITLNRLKAGWEKMQSL